VHRPEHLNDDLARSRRLVLRELLARGRSTHADRAAMVFEGVTRVSWIQWFHSGNLATRDEERYKPDTVDVAAERLRES
jgi:hypothetical protein